MKRRRRRVRPLGTVTPKYNGDRYPDIILVPMEDGRVLHYRIDDRPQPGFLEAMNILHRWTETEKTGAVTAAPAMRENNNVLHQTV